MECASFVEVLYTKMAAYSRLAIPFCCMYSPQGNRGRRNECREVASIDRPVPVFYLLRGFYAH